MIVALTVLIIQGSLGAIDTFYYHEWRLRLPATPKAWRELRLHAGRDFLYAILFGTLGWLRWEGWLAWVLGLVLLGEVIITLLDFLEEDETRKLPRGERIMHSIMAILYGIFLACFIPILYEWSLRTTQWAVTSYGWISWLMSLMALGVFGSGVRDLIASAKLSRS